MHAVFVGRRAQDLEQDLSILQKRTAYTWLDDVSNTLAPEIHGGFGGGTTVSWSAEIAPTQDF